MRSPTGRNVPDLSICDQEQIHLLGRIQNFGQLIGLNDAFEVQFVSANIASLLGHPPEAILGQTIDELAPKEFIHTLRNQANQLALKGDTQRAFSRRLLGHGRDLQLTSIDGGYLLEVEPAETPGADRQGAAQSLIRRLRGARTLSALASMTARIVRSVTDFDRVMVYRFADDDTGEVIAETCASGLESFLGLRYPATDIPRQARELYRRKTIRLIADVDDPGVGVLSAVPGTTVDLSDSLLRSVSPVHIEYLRNMGVAASMSMSLIVGGKLWGLIACHHAQPRRPALAVRSLCELIADVASIQIESLEHQAREAVSRTIDTFRSRLLEQMATSQTPREVLWQHVPDLLPILNCSGAAIISADDMQTCGRVPEPDILRQLCSTLIEDSPAGIIYRERASEQCAALTAAAELAAGFCAIPLQRVPNEFLVFFRPELIREVQWAGHPDKAVILADDGLRLSPRKSFAAWRESVTGACAPWSARDRWVASGVRFVVIEVVQRHADALASADRQHREEQELLVAELNHRVRNVLALVRALVNQSRSETDSARDFVDSLQSRVDSLARAHDLLTAAGSTAGSLTRLIHDEVDAYIGEKIERLEIHGPHIRLRGDALSTMAMVVHELVTNAAKYGALCDSMGRVRVNLSRLGGGAVRMRWEEIGGPSVKPPTRRGFGSTVIERAVAFTLEGRASLSYRVAGVQADIEIPARHVVSVTSSDTAVQDIAGAVRPSLPAPEMNSGAVLIVEDSLLVAMDAEAACRALGAAAVDVAGGVARARELLQRTRPDFAILDIHLGDETSFALAEELLTRQIPFVFATGYGDSNVIPGRFADVPVISKPYSHEQIAAAYVASQEAA
ncbi:MAG: HWE histidine kinase domain-containing protein [Burkholderiaceae bacterium]